MPKRITAQYIRTGVLLLLFGWHVVLLAQFSEAQLQWLESEGEHPAQEVNEGKLEFIPAAADKPEHRQSMQITLTDETIESGWALVTQCHDNLDRVERLEIVFHKDRVRNLQVTEYSNIQNAWAEDQRVVVRNVQKDSRICLRAESRIFHRLVSDRHQPMYEMVNGPFMRRFLDGFYPLTLSLNVSYPNERLRLLDIQPSPQPGWKVSYDANRIFLRGRFEGKLSTRLRFSLIK